MNNREDQIANFASCAIDKLWEDSEDVSKATKSAQKVCQRWQESCKKLKNLKAEVSVGDNLNEKIDIIDFDECTAYELKVSENNPHFEFYKNIFKVIAYNRNNSKAKVKKLIFMNPEKGAEKIRKGLAEFAIELAKEHGIIVEIIGLKKAELPQNYWD